MASLELRNANRYHVAALVFFWWLGSDEFVHTGQGTTRDISSSGVLITAGVCPPSGVKIHLEVRLPQIKGSDRGMVLKGEGLVVRLDDGKTAGCPRRRAGFAVSVQFYPEKVSISEELPHLAMAPPYVN